VKEAFQELLKLESRNSQLFNDSKTPDKSSSASSLAKKAVKPKKEKKEKKSEKDGEKKPANENVSLCKISKFFLSV
jgi:hypothetical protein